MNKRSLTALAFVVTAVLTSCISYPEMVFTPSGDILVAEGVIDGKTLGNLQAALEENPGITELVLLYIPGSADDENSLTELSGFIHDSGLTTVVPADGMVASGGTDMILMGKTRRIEPGACIGVHSWAASDGPSAEQETGSDIPRDHPDHQLYLNFYDKVGIPEDFYWFTLESAGPDDIHWMAEDEINRYGLSTFPVNDTPPETEEQRSNRCNMR